MRLTTTTLFTFAVGLALLVPGGVLGIPGATGQTPVDSGPPSVSLTTPAEAPSNLLADTTKHGDGAIVETTLDVDTLDGLAGALQPRQVAALTNVDEHNRETTVWINAETLAADGIQLINHETGNSLRGPANAVRLGAGETLVVSVDPDSVSVSTADSVATTVQFVVEPHDEAQSHARQSDARGA